MPQTEGTSNPTYNNDVNNPEPNDSLSASLMQPNAPAPFPNGAPPQVVQAPQAATPAPENTAQNLAGRAWGKVLNGLSGGHNEYTVDPQTGKTVSTFVKDSPGQTFKSILALGLMGGQGIGPQHGEYTFTQGLLSGLGGGAREAQERSDFLDKQRREQAQQEYANHLRAAQEDRENKKLTMEQQLNQVAIADHNQRLALTAQQMHQQAIEFNQRQGTISAAPFVKNSEMMVEAGKPMIDGYKSLNIDPIASGLDEEGVSKYIADHPGTTTKEMAVPVGTRQTMDPNTGEVKVQTLYNVYQAMDKVPPSLLQELEKDGAANPKSTLHNAYKYLTTQKDGTVDARKLLPIYRDMTNWENLQEASLNRRVKESEIARNFAGLDREKLELQLARMKLDDEKNAKEAMTLYNKSFDPTTNGFRQDVLSSLEPTLDAKGQPATPADAEKLRQRNLLLAAVNGQIEGKTSELYDKYKPRKNEFGQLVFDDPAATMQIDYIKNLKNAATQLLHPETFAQQQALYNTLSPSAKMVVDRIKGSGQVPDAVTLARSLSSAPPADQVAIFKVFGLTPPSPQQIQQNSGANPIFTGNDRLSPVGNAVVNIGKDVINNPSRFIP